MKVIEVGFDGEPLLSPDPEPGWWLLRAPYRIWVKIEGDDGSFRWIEIIVPAGYRTDLESIPKWTPITRAYLYGVARRAALAHDYLYSIQAGKQFADDVFLAAMVAEQVPFVARWILYLAVHWFGHVAYNSRDPADRLPTPEGET